METLIIVTHHLMTTMAPATQTCWDETCSASLVPTALRASTVEAVSWSIQYSEYVIDNDEQRSIVSEGITLTNCSYRSSEEVISQVPGFPSDRSRLASEKFNSYREELSQQVHLKKKIKLVNLFFWSRSPLKILFLW